MRAVGQNDACPVCSARLEPLKMLQDSPCLFCGSPVQQHSVCPDGHAVCGACSSRSAIEVIENTALASTSKDPAEIAELLMSHPRVPAAGCEHAFIAAASIMAAIRNSPYGKGKIGEREIRQVFERTVAQAREGSCSLTGVCGIAPAVGACFSVFLGALRSSDAELRIVMETVTRLSRVMAALAGPSCCKAFVRAAVAEAAAVFSERFGIVLPIGNAQPLCRHSDGNPHGCREEKCPYYHRPTTDIFALTGFVPGTVCTS